jgi:hypothetical protein
VPGFQNPAVVVDQRFQAAGSRGRECGLGIGDREVRGTVRAGGLQSATRRLLIPKHQDLDILGCLGPSEQRQPAQHAGERQVCESKGHGERFC